MHDTITVGIPILAILFGILWNQQGLKDLRSDMRDFKGEMNAHLNRLETKSDRMQADLSQFYRDLGNHNARIEMLEKRG